MFPALLIVYVSILRLPALQNAAVYRNFCWAQLVDFLYFFLDGEGESTSKGSWQILGVFWHLSIEIIRFLFIVRFFRWTTEIVRDERIIQHWLSMFCLRILQGVKPWKITGKRFGAAFLLEISYPNSSSFPHDFFFQNPGHYHCPKVSISQATVPPKASLDSHTKKGYKLIANFQWKENFDYRWQSAIFPSPSGT